MKTLGCVVILLLASLFLYGRPKFIVAVLCRRRHLDMSGTLIRCTARPRPRAAPVLRPPWDSLAGVIGGQWGVPASLPGYTRPLLSSVPYFHVVNGKQVYVADQIGNPPVQPGDAIMLMSGNYGDIVIGDFNVPTINSDFVTVEAAPGQIPVFSTLGIDRTNKWVFDAIKVQSLLGANGNFQPLVSLMDQGAAFPTTDIILENMQISSADNTAGWSQAQWLAQSRTGISERGSAGNGANGEPYTNCISVAGSHIQNVHLGVILAANNSLFTNNVIDHFGDDGIDYAANNLAITHNTLHDNLDMGDGNHEDAMQGQNGPLAAGVVYNAFSNILIDSNLIIRADGPEQSVSDLSAGDRRLRRGLDERYGDEQRCDHQRLSWDHLREHPQWPNCEQYSA